MFNINQESYGPSNQSFCIVNIIDQNRDHYPHVTYSNIKPAKIYDFINVLNNSFDISEIYDTSKWNNLIIYQNEFKTVIISVIDQTIVVMGTTYKSIVNFLDINQSFLYPVPNNKGTINISYYFMEKGQVLESIIPINLKQVLKIYPELYPDIDVNKLIVEFLKAQESILFLHGMPGVGKTTFLKLILQNENCQDISYIKDSNVMESSSLWSMLSSVSNRLIIFDDLDFSLLPRQEGGSNFVGNLLSYSDGIFTSRGTKIIITTNMILDKVDAALIRPGRCFDFINLRDLSYEEAKNIWISILKMDEENFVTFYTNSRHRITQASLMSNYNRVINSQKIRSYIKCDKNSYTLEEKLSSEGIAFDNCRGGF